jgi:c-di-GMP-binding flagellar brake protein YcgR
LSVNGMIRINLKIEVAKENKEDKGEFYFSSIQDINGETDLFIAAPYLKGAPLSLKVGESVVVRFVENNGVYSFTSKVLGMQKDSIPLYRLEFPGHIKRSQRRRYVRIPALIEVLLTKGEIKDKNFFIENENKAEVVNTLDISAGGMRFHSNKRYLINTTFLAKFLLNKGKNDIEIKALTKVLRCEEITVNGRQKFLALNLLTSIPANKMKYSIMCLPG